MRSNAVSALAALFVVSSALVTHAEAQPRIGGGSSYLCACATFFSARVAHVDATFLYPAHDGPSATLCSSSHRCTALGSSAHLSAAICHTPSFRRTLYCNPAP